MANIHAPEGLGRIAGGFNRRTTQPPPISALKGRGKRLQSLATQYVPHPKIQTELRGINQHNIRVISTTKPGINQSLMPVVNTPKVMYNGEDKKPRLTGLASIQRIRAAPARAGFDHANHRSPSIDKNPEQ